VNRRKTAVVVVLPKSSAVKVPKSAPLRSISPALKDVIDICVVPTLVKNYLKAHTAEAVAAKQKEVAA
jgi:hypothetical protein